MEQAARSRPYGRATQHSSHSTKFTNDTDLTKSSNQKYSGRKKYKRNVSGNFHKDKLESDGTSMSSSVTHKAGVANCFSETHSKINPQSPNKHFTRISRGAHSSNQIDQQAGLSHDKSSQSSVSLQGNNSESISQWQRNGSEPSKPYTNYQLAVSDGGNGHQNFNNQERSLPPSPGSYQDQTTDNTDYAFINVKETNFPQPSYTEQVYVPPAVDYYQINNWQPTSEVTYLEHNFPQAHDFSPFLGDSKQSPWDSHHYMENSLIINPHFEHTRAFKPLPIYTDLYYPLPGHLNAAWGMPYYTRGGLFVNPLATCGIGHFGGLMNVNP